LTERQEEIHKKGFDMYRRASDYSSEPTDYNSIKVGVKKLDDATLNLGKYKKMGVSLLGDKNYVLDCLANRNAEALREISDYFFTTNGIYQRVCCYFATMYRYDWYISAELYEDSNKIKENKIKKDFRDLLKYLDDSYIKKNCAQIALEVIKYGCY